MAYSNSFKRSVTIKLVTIGVLALVLLIPSYLIQNIIKERKQYQEEARQDISSKWGGQQIVSGPVLQIPVTFDRNNTQTRKLAKFLPKDLNITGNVMPQKRKRGIFKILVYQADLQVEGTFQPFSFDEWEADSLIVHWNEAQLSTGISDLKGLKSPININWDGTEITPNRAINNSANLSNLKNQSASFQFDLIFNGTRELFFTPSGANTTVQISSPWNSPSFTGNYLPDTKNISRDGFQASWNILKFNRSYPQQWVDDSHDVSDAVFGFKLLKPVDQYQKAMRSVKYAILFIALTFITFFFTEQFSRAKMHPVQYLLVGVALLVFFTLLLALSEVIAFNLAYLIAAAANTLLITTYAGKLFNSKKITGITGAVLVLLYGFLFSILQLEQHALLIGSIGLFIIIALLMYLSLIVNWYGHNTNGEE